MGGDKPSQRTGTGHTPTSWASDRLVGRWAVSGDAERWMGERSSPADDEGAFSEDCDTITALGTIPAAVATPPSQPEQRAA